MTDQKQVNSKNQNGAGLNRDFPRRGRSLIIKEEGSGCMGTEAQK